MSIIFFFFWIKIESQKFVTFLDTTSDDKDLPRFVTKKWIEVYDQSGGNYNVNQIRSDLCDYSGAYIVVEGDIVIKKIFAAADFERPQNTNLNATNTNNANNIAFGEKNWFLKIMHHLSIAFQKLMG